jgi:uncharacterized protein
MRFVADAMLGRLARWLRILGYDTLYDVSWPDVYLVRLARAEDRMLLTRDYELAHRIHVLVTLIESECLTEQLAQLQRELAINCNNAPRCPMCNSLLEPISKEEAWDKVPLFAYIDNEAFSHCPTCGRYYWPGTHWKRIRELLSKAIP